MLLNNNELAAVKDCLKRYIEFNNNGLMSSYKVKQSSLLLMNEKEIDIDYKKMIVLKGSMYDEFKSLEDEKEVF